MMQVTKRGGAMEPVRFDKITQRLQNLREMRPALEGVDVTRVAASVCASVQDGISTSRLDELAAEAAAALGTEHPGYAALAARVLVSNLQKNTSDSVLDTYERMAELLDPDFLRAAREHAAALQSFVDYDSDFEFDFFGFKTMEKMYLTRVGGAVVERPQHMWLRVALALWKDDLARVRETYDHLRRKSFTHASPTLFNAGLKQQQCASCYLTGIHGDSIDGIFDALTKCARISKHGGGIGIHVSGVRGKGAPIRGTNGESDGLVPMLRVVNAVASYVNQCFAPETKVYTRDRGTRRVDEITTEDYLCTRDGTWQKVNEVIVNDAEDAEVLRLSVKHAIEPVTVTPVHEILALRGQKIMTNYNVITRRLEQGTAAPEFVPAADLVAGDMMVFPIPREEVDVDETEDHLRMYGIMLGDGHLCTGRKEAGVTLGDRKEATMNFVRSFLADRGVHAWETPGHGCTQIRWTMRAAAFDIPRGELYTGDNVKWVHPRFLNMPARKTAALLRGLLETDGSVGGEIYFTSSSARLVEAVRYMCLRLGILTAGNVRDRVGEAHDTPLGGQIETKKVHYSLRIPRHPVLWELGAVTSGEPSRDLRFLRWNDMLFTRIQSIERARHTGPLYDFNMEHNHNYLTDVGLVHNSGKRKGSIAVYIEPHHPDILDVLALKRNGGDEHLRARDLFFAVWVPDLFMRRVEAGGSWSLFDPAACPGLADVWGREYDELYERYEAEGRAARTLPAQDLWFEILRSQIETGTPYILFKDSANAKSNQQNLGTIKCSNLCVAGDTRILTSTGYHPISSLAGQRVRVWNGEAFSETTVLQTGADQELVTVVFDDGTELRCTPYHKFYVETASRPACSSRPVTLEASRLQEGDRLIKFDLPTVIAGASDRDPRRAYTDGFFCADGYVDRAAGQAKISVHRADKKAALADRAAFESVYEYGDRTTYKLGSAADFCKYAVPLNSSPADKLRWLEGYLDGDGSVVRNDGIENIQASSVCKEFLNDIRLMLQTLGVFSTVTLARSAGTSALPDGRGGEAEYETKALWRLHVGSTGLRALVSLGFSPSRLRITGGRAAHHETHKYTRVVCVERRGEREDTYCFNEPLRHAGVFEGVLTGQCSEIIEFTAPDEVAVCTLGSLSLPAFVSDGKYDFEALMAATRVLARNLDRVIDVTYYPIEEARRSNLRHRPVGIGAQGLQDVFYALGLPFDSPEAAALNRQIFESVYFAAVETSCQLAREHGRYSTFEGSPAAAGRLQFDLWGVEPSMPYAWGRLKSDVMEHGLRNSLSVAPMPTASTANILGNVESTEPITSNMYSRRTLAGEFAVVNRWLVDDLMERGLWSREVKDAILARGGSVQGVPQIPEDLQRLYKTAWELSMKTVIDMAADRGAFVCQSQSTNLFVAEPTFKKLSSMHFYAWKRGLKTGVYYLRSRPAAQAVQVTLAPQHQPQQPQPQPQPDDTECLACGG